jgi:SpoVK/Ycf46/Vps4 family AAA+-type ATPase
VVILTTNRRQDIDEAFLRRLRFIVEFPVPDPAKRDRIWEEVFPSKSRRLILILITGFALYAGLRWLRRCCRSNSAKSVQEDAGDAVEQKSSGSKADRVD